MSRYGLFEVFGIELEYMIVDRATLSVLPIADKLLTRAAGELTSDFEDGPITWSNELALHVIELKTTEPVRSLVGVADQFQSSVKNLNRIAAEFGAVLLPTGMHPWMNPFQELKLWPHDSADIYEAFNRVFDCRGHGWANLQSMHINLPFANDDEFGRLHAAIRLLLPLLPGLACSSPIAEGRATGFLDYRMEVYRHNSAKIPQVAGQIVPEPVFSEAAYHEQIFQPLFRAIAPHDPDGILQKPFLNARGAIARFDRGSIEIRVIDTQEHPGADLAIAQLVIAILQALVAEQWTPTLDQRRITTDSLGAIFRSALRDGEQASVAEPEYLRQFGLEQASATAQELWRHLRQQVAATSTTAAQLAHDPNLNMILDQGPLARRILAAIPPHEWTPAPNVPSGRSLSNVYQNLTACLGQGHSFDLRSSASH
ncbi:MAG: glutamate-cysteine ligase family protein [Pirellulaceae bacterium]|nr:glutamate-cysteine ligase family protein [Pirellulaceae bacterium]